MLTVESGSWTGRRSAINNVIELAGEITTASGHRRDMSGVSNKPRIWSDLEKAHFKEDVRRVRRAEMAKSIPYTRHLRPMPPPFNDTPEITYHYRRTPNIGYSLLTYKGTDPNGTLLVGDALHVFDDEDNPHKITTAFTRTNRSLSENLYEIFPTSIAEASPHLMEGIYERLAAVRDADMARERQAVTTSVLQRAGGAILRAIPFVHGDVDR